MTNNIKEVIEKHSKDIFENLVRDVLHTYYSKSLFESEMNFNYLSDTQITHSTDIRRQTFSLYSLFPRSNKKLASSLLLGYFLSANMYSDIICNDLIGFNPKHGHTYYHNKLELKFHSNLNALNSTGNYGDFFEINKFKKYYLNLCNKYLTN